MGTMLKTVMAELQTKHTEMYSMFNIRVQVLEIAMHVCAVLKASGALFVREVSEMTRLHFIHFQILILLLEKF